MATPFPVEPSLTLFDPLAELLGAGDGLLHYQFNDVVKLSGHACPTVAGAFLMVIKALKGLYGEEVPTRGDIQISIPGPLNQGVNGPISQVFTLLTGAAGFNGFHGLAGAYKRSGLLSFDYPRPSNGFIFKRIDRDIEVGVTYDPSPIPASPEMGPLLQQILQGQATSATKAHFQTLWVDRVNHILEDKGEQTVRVSQK